MTGRPFGSAQGPEGLALQSFDKLMAALCSGTGWVAINRQGLILGGRPCLGNVALAVLGSRLGRQGRKAIFRPCPTLRSGSEHLLVLNRGGLVGVDDHGADLNGMGLVRILDLEGDLVVPERKIIL